MDLQNKEINPKWLEEETSFRTKVWLWWDEHTPIPYSVRFWFNEKDIFHPTRIYRKISNIVRWIPLLWDDVDWDYTSLYAVIHFKIKNMREHTQEHNMHVGCEDDAKQMQTAEECMDRLIKDDYCTKGWEEHTTKFPCNNNWIDLPNGMRQMPPLSDEARADLLKLSDEEERLRQQDLDTFATTFTKYVRGWWC